MNLRAICIGAGVLLLLAIPAIWPYNFYILLRWVIFIASLFIAYGFYQSKLNFWAGIFAVIGIVFNPLMPFYFDKSTWVIIDLICAVLYFIAGYSYKKK